MNINLSIHSFQRETNLKLDSKDLLKISNDIINIFELDNKKKENGFYKIYYDNLIIVLLKENIDFKLITLYPKHSMEIIMLNINFENKKCIFEGQDNGNRLKINIPKAIIKKKKRFHKNQVKRFKNGKLINHDLTYKKVKKISGRVKILKSMKKSMKDMLSGERNALFTLHGYKDIYEKIIFNKVSLSNIKYIIRPRVKLNPNGFYYLLNDKQKLVRTLHKKDFMELIKVPEEL